MICPKCGNSLPEGAAFCPSCGSTLGDASAPQSSFQQPASQSPFQSTSQSQSPFQPQGQSQPPFQQSASQSPFQPQGQSQSPFQQQASSDFQQQSKGQSPFQPQSPSSFQSQGQSPFQQQAPSGFQASNPGGPNDPSSQSYYQPSGSGYFNDPAPKKKSKKPLIIGVVAGVVALIAIVLLVIFVVLPAFSGGSEGEKGGAPVTSEQKADGVHDSVDGIIDEMNDSTDKLIAGKFSTDAYDEWIDVIGDLAPKDAREAFIDGAGDETGIEELGVLLDYMDMEIVFDQGEELSSSELDDINDELADAGSSAEATSGYNVSMEMTATLLEDMNGFEAGETQSETQDESDLYIIEIDGSWYLWG